MAELFATHLARSLSDGERQFRVRIPHFRLTSGDRIAILGQTGAGKTTALDMLALASRPDTAARFRLRVRDKSIDLSSLRREADLARLRARHFGYLLQTSPLFPFLSLGENAVIGQQLAGVRDRAAIRRLLAAVGLDLPLKASVAAMSVGQRQRLALVRAIAHRPSFIFCDEPTGALDPATADQLILTLIAEADRTEAGIVMITHDEGLARRHGFECWRMQRTTMSQDVSLLVPPAPVRWASETADALP